MSRGLAFLSVPLLLAVTPAFGQAAPATAPAPPVEAAPALPPPPEAAVDRLEDILWQAAAATNTEASYRTYLNRYADGTHAEDAKAAIDALRRAPPPSPANAAEPAVTPAPIKPAAPLSPPPAPPSELVAAPIAPASDAAPFICRPAFTGEPPFEEAADADISAYLQAIRINSLGSYQTYLQAYPHGVFAPEVAEAVAARQGRMTALSNLGGPGPASPRARIQVAPTEADYPSIALREAQQGKTTAIWEIAEDGCVEACRIDKSSGSAALDAASCRMITLKGRYDPALNAQGKPIRAVDSATFTWRLPQH